LGSSAAPLDAKLSPLQDNGGSTLTMALSLGSPAVNKGISNGLTTDQRGAPRPFDFSGITRAMGGDGSDIGAFELNPPRLSIARSSENVVLSWPAYFFGYYGLQSVTTLPASNHWTFILTPQVVIGSRVYVTNSVSGPQTFYRLVIE